MVESRISSELGTISLLFPQHESQDFAYAFERIRLYFPVAVQVLVDGRSADARFVHQSMRRPTPTFQFTVYYISEHAGPLSYLYWSN